MDWEVVLGSVNPDRVRGSRKTGCEHTHTVTTFIAGLARSVCESCGKVSIRYLGEGTSYPELRGPSRRAQAPETEPPPTAAGRGLKRTSDPTCKRCRGEAKFITPWGLACPEHAWEAASSQDPLAGDFWIPLLIDRSDIPG